MEQGFSLILSFAYMNAEIVKTVTTGRGGARRQKEYARRRQFALAAFESGEGAGNAAVKRQRRRDGRDQRSWWYCTYGTRAWLDSISRETGPLLR